MDGGLVADGEFAEPGWSATAHAAPIPAARLIGRFADRGRDASLRPACDMPPLITLRDRPQEAWTQAASSNVNRSGGP
ncbi:hypothetical protein Acsp04_50860 [Actinomadura sp. NBRC 104425]|nr:hypothetical protein Acsp04_50860 [Actinomadura sp. NBRC 104425]